MSDEVELQDQNGIGGGHFSQFQHGQAAAAYRRTRALTRAEFGHRLDAYTPASATERLNVAPTTAQSLGGFTIACLILNRTIGTGIVVLPTSILQLAGSSGVAILLWVTGGVIALSFVLCWLELGMTVPFERIIYRGVEQKISTPRSGGEKNYLEYIYKRPRYLMKCVYGVIFIVFGHLSGNALQFGIFMQRAIAPQCEEGKPCFNKAAVLAWAVGISTLCALINVCARQFTIGINNVFAVLKASFIAIIALVGIFYGAKHGDGCRKIEWKNQGSGGGFGDIALALLYATYPYTGFEQPFYVLAEVKKPRRIFPKAVIYTMLGLLLLYPLTNIGYLCMTPYTGNDSVPSNMVIEMFARISRASSLTGDTSSSRGSVQAVSVLLSLSIFGNIMAQTFTASRVKQEIAKEGILPWSLQFATGSNSLVSRLIRPALANQVPTMTEIEAENYLEQVPIYATILHWFFEVLLILAVGIPSKPSNAYLLLAYFKMFAIVGVLGLFTVGGLLYLKIDSRLLGERGRHWYRRARCVPWTDPLPVVFATLCLLFLLFATFAKPSVTVTGDLQHWVGPLAGWIITLSSVLYWVGLKGILYRTRRELVQEREPYIEIDDEGEPILKAEFVRFDFQRPEMQKPQDSSQDAV